MLAGLKNVKDADALNKLLQDIIFPGIPFDSTIDFGEKWQLETEDGEDYVQKHGLWIVCKGLEHAATW